jgi:uncharacterized protein (DUF433 family)
MNWKQHIEIKPNVLAGKPVIKNTRLSVEFLLDLLANDWTIEQLLENYPQLTRENIQAIFAFTAACLHDEQFIIYATIETI